MTTATVLVRDAETRLPTVHGDFRLIAFQDGLEREPHLALVAGELGGDMPPLIRLHSECLTGDALGSLRCDCGPQLDQALALVAGEGRGAVLYLRQEGRGVGLLRKLRAYALQDQGYDTVEANELLGLPVDARDYRAAAAILRDLGVPRIRLLTNNPAKVAGLEEAGIAVVERVPIVVAASPNNHHYLVTKRDKMGHLMDIDPCVASVPASSDEELDARASPCAHHQRRMSPSKWSIANAPGEL